MSNEYLLGEEIGKTPNQSTVKNLEKKKRVKDLAGVFLGTPLRAVWSGGTHASGHGLPAGEDCSLAAVHKASPPRRLQKSLDPLPFTIGCAKCGQRD